jgi:hypothetical protein
MPLMETFPVSITTAPHLKSGLPVYDQTVWLRLPRPGSRCPVTGLSRSSLAELARPCERNGYRAPVGAKVLKRRGATRGVLLISRQSLLDYLGDLPSPTSATHVNEIDASREGKTDGTA